MYLSWDCPSVPAARVCLWLCPLGYSVVVFLKYTRPCSATAWVQLFLERTLGCYRIFFVGNTVLLPLADQEEAKQIFHLLTQSLKVCHSIDWQQFKETEFFRDTDSWKALLVFSFAWIWQGNTWSGWMPETIWSAIILTWALFFRSWGRSLGLGQVSSR